MRIEIERYKDEITEELFKSDVLIMSDEDELVKEDGYVLNTLEHEYKEYGDTVYCNSNDEGVIFKIAIRHVITEEDIYKYGDEEKAYMIYKDGMPFYLYILINNSLIKCIIDYIKLGNDIRGNFAVIGYYRKYEVYNVDKSDTYKKMLLIGVPEEGLSDSVIKKMIEQGTRVEIE